LRSFVDFDERFGTKIGLCYAFEGRAVERTVPAGQRSLVVEREAF
jgi:hypothetical protein